MPAIKVENRSKSYLVGHNAAQGERYTALRDVITRNARDLAHKTRDMIQGRPIFQARDGYNQIAGAHCWRVLCGISK